MRRTGGFSLIEVVIAVALLAIVVLAVAGLQVTALRGSGQAAIVREATRLGESALEQELRAAGASPCDGGALDGGYSCTVRRVPCEQDGDDVACTDGAAGDAGEVVEITATGPRDVEIVLRRWTP